MNETERSDAPVGIRNSVIAVSVLGIAGHVCHSLAQQYDRGPVRGNWRRHRRWKLVASRANGARFLGTQRRNDPLEYRRSLKLSYCLVLCTCS